MKPVEPYTLRGGGDTHPLLPNHKDRDACYTCVFRLNKGVACGYLWARHRIDTMVPTLPSSHCDNYEDDSGIPF